VLCQALDGSPSGYYAWKHREVSQHAREDARLAAEIQQVFLEHQKRYGSPRIHAALQARGMHCSRKRVVRLMQQLGISAAVKRSRKPTTKGDPRARFAPNLLNRDFTAERPNTRLRDRYQSRGNRRGLAVPGCHCGSLLAHGGWMGDGDNRRQRADRDGCAHGRRATASGIRRGSHHSDRGTEFTSDRYQAALGELGVELISMSRTGNCWDNAAMEAFFATLAKECTNRVRFQTRQEARSAIFEYLECFYNPIRLHSTLQYMSPIAFEQANGSPLNK
jgi:putative transposase